MAKGALAKEEIMNKILEVFPGSFRYDKEEQQLRKDRELTKLLFVGITRAKHSLCLSFADMCDKKNQQITKYLADFANYDFDSQQFAQATLSPFRPLEAVQ